MNLLPGSYVTHAKLPELGSGEILAMQDGRVSIRFASGNRDFMVDRVVKHLTVTTEAPVAPEPTKKAKRPRKAAAAKQPAAAKQQPA
ncbi:MAG: DUF3553 domain-containing protein [Polyangiales bacterium]